MNERTRSITASLLLVISGAAGGVVVDHLVILHHHAGAHAATADHAAILLAELDKVLDLTPGQHDSIGAIITSHQRAIDSAWRAIHRNMDSGMDSVHREVAKILRPEQMTKLMEWIRRQQ